MIKVDNLIFEPSSQNKKTNSSIAVSEIRLAPMSPNEVFKSFNSLNKAQISFKGIDYYKTLSDNYFKLNVNKKEAPDIYQKEAAEHLYNGEDVLVTAPTGTGKTAIAFYTISKNLEDGKRTFYTTPLKALSNEKYKQLQSIYGKNNVGLLTGDVKINGEAPIVVMTTEIYRNMVFAKSFKDKEACTNMEGLKTVIFDELHYLGDVDRGGIWEQSIVLSDKNTQMLSLSATIGNNNSITNWMSKIRGAKTALVNVPPENRHVPLIPDEFIATSTESEIRKANELNKTKESENQCFSPLPDDKSYFELIKMLKGRDELPAICFVFSKKYSQKLLSEFATGDYITDKKEKIHVNTNLLTDDERNEVKETIERYKNDGKYLGETLHIPALLKGYSIHNAGLLPNQKELIEELFQKKLIKVVIATETLAAGINMPARTVVISSNRKPTSTLSVDGMDGKRELTPNEFHQMAGRAGRRGIDDLGHVYTMSTTEEQMQKFDDLVKSKPNDLTSSFIPEFSFIAGYYKYTQADDIITDIMKKSLFCYDEDEKKAELNLEQMMFNFNEKKALLNDFEFINNDNVLTMKGQLLASLNGYHQIPIIDTIYNKKLDGLDPIELAASVGAMANIKEAKESNLENLNESNNKQKKDKKKNKEEEQFVHENQVFNWFIEYFDKELNKYNRIMDQHDMLPVLIEQNKDSAEHIYKWAELNSKNKDSRRNWKNLYKEYAENEGGLFREIANTVDLLKQISKISELGYKLAENENDKKYYSELNSNIKKSIKLLSHEPISELKNN